jgi:hypothetical protein
MYRGDHLSLVIFGPMMTFRQRVFQVFFQFCVPYMKILVNFLSLASATSYYVSMIYIATILNKFANQV